MCIPDLTSTIYGYLQCGLHGRIPDNFLPVLNGMPSAGPQGYTSVHHILSFSILMSAYLKHRVPLSQLIKWSDISFQITQPDAFRGPMRSCPRVWTAGNHPRNEMLSLSAPCLDFDLTTCLRRRCAAPHSLTMHRPTSFIVCERGALARPPQGDPVKPVSSMIQQKSRCVGGLVEKQAVSVGTTRNRPPVEWNP